jgi:hypothetical protein
VTEDVRRRRELSISDYGFVVHAESVFIDRGGYRYLVHTPSSRTVQPRTRVADDRASEVTQRVIACALAVFVCGTFLAAIWFAYFAPSLALPPTVALRASSPAPLRNMA